MLESMLEILAEDFPKEHEPDKEKHVIRIKDAYCKIQEKYKAMTGQYFEQDVYKQFIVAKRNLE